MRVRQGEVYHVNLPPPIGSGPGGRRYAVVIQHDARNKSGLATVVVCVTTETLRLGKVGGNVELFPGEANLPEHCVVNVSQILTLDKEKQLGDYVGSLHPDTMKKILQGVRRMFEGYTVPY